MIQFIVPLIHEIKYIWKSNTHFKRPMYEEFEEIQKRDKEEEVENININIKLSYVSLLLSHDITSDKILISIIFLGFIF